MKIKNKKLRIFMSRKMSVIGLVVFIIILFAAFVGPYLTTHSPFGMDIHNRFAGISSRNWLGTDGMGRDIFTRVIHGGQVSIGLALFGVSLGAGVGIVFGVFAGFYGGFLDAIISRVTDFLMAVPSFMIAIVSLLVLGSGGVNAAIAVGISLIPVFMRMTRGGVIAIKDLDYVKSCRILGISDSRILMTHVLPGVIPLIVVTFTINLGAALLTISTLSFLGIGVNPPNPEWGALIADSRQHILDAPLLLLGPGLAAMLFVMSTSLIGDGLRDALDSKSVEGV